MSFTPGQMPEHLALTADREDLGDAQKLASSLSDVSTQAAGSIRTRKCVNASAYIHSKAEARTNALERTLLRPRLRSDSTSRSHRIEQQEAAYGCVYVYVQKGIQIP